MKKVFPYIVLGLGLIFFAATIALSTMIPAGATGTSEGVRLPGAQDWQIMQEDFTGTFVGGSDTYTTQLADADYVEVWYTGATSGTLFPIGQVVSAANGTIKVFGDSSKTYWAVVVDKVGE